MPEHAHEKAPVRGNVGGSRTALAALTQPSAGVAGALALQRLVGNRATATLIAGRTKHGRRGVETGAAIVEQGFDAFGPSGVPVNRCSAPDCIGARDRRSDDEQTGHGEGGASMQRLVSLGGDGGETTRGALQRKVDPVLGQAIDAGRFPGSAAAHPPLLDIVQVFDGLSPDDKRDTVRGLTAGQQLTWVQFCLNNRRDDLTWHVIIETVSTASRVFAVQSLMSAKRMNEPHGPWGAYGVLNGLSDADQLAVLNQLIAPERTILQQGLASAPIDRLRLERQLAAVDPDTVPPVRPVYFPVVWVADELPPRAATAAGASAYMGSQGAHAVAGSDAASGLRMIGTRYWRAMIPSRRAIELQRVLNELPRDLTPWLQTHLANTPQGQTPDFPWVSQNIGAMDRPFTVPELESIPALVAKFNANANALTPAEATLLSRVVSLHVGGAHRGGSPLTSWSVPPKRGQPEPVTWSADRRFKVKADFQKSAVLDNTRASAANTLSPADSNLEAGLNPDEAEYLATAASDARVLTVEPLSGAVKGELVSGSTAWMARNATQLRWAGRGMIVVSFAISGYRIATTDEAHRARVIGEEAGAQFFGFGGAILAGAACVGLGIATGGVGLVLCGMAGGLLGGMAGSALGGAAADAGGRSVTPYDPFGLTTGHPAPGQLAGQSSDDANAGWMMAAPPEVLIY